MLSNDSSAYDRDDSQIFQIFMVHVTHMEFAPHLSIQKTTILISVSWDEKLVQIAVSICHKVCNWVKHPVQSIRYTEEDDRKYNTHSAAERVYSYFYEQYNSLHYTLLQPLKSHSGLRIQILLPLQYCLHFAAEWFKSRPVAKRKASLQNSTYISMT